MDTTMVTFNKAKRVQSMRKRKAARNEFLQNLIMNSLMIVGCIFLLYSPTKQFFFLHLPNMLFYLSSPKCVFLLVNVIVVFLVGESRLSGYKGSRKSYSTSDVYDEYVRRVRAQRKSVTVTSSLISIREKPADQVACKEEKEIVTVDKTKSLEDEAVASQAERRIVVVVDDGIRSFEDEVVVSHTGNGMVTTNGITSLANEANEQEEQQVIKEEVNNGEKVEEQVEEKIERVEEMEEKGGGDELNKRIEDFIARVNRQRQIEIQSLVSCEA